MSIMDDYKQLRMIENIKNFKEMELAYKANLKLCKYQEQQINKLATCIEDIAENIKEMNNECFYSDFDCKYCDMKNGCTYHRKIKILQKISECEAKNER